MNKKGFTLIELLAVIVILAIIGLIATPIVINIIDSAKTSSSEISEKNYKRAVELSIADYQLKNPQVSLSGTYEIKENGKKIKLNSIEILIDYDGPSVTSGSIIYQNNIVTLSDDFMLENSSNTTKICRLTNGTKGSVGSKYECDVNDDDTFTFYLLSTNTTNSEVTSYNLIMERNICYNGTVATASNTCLLAWYSSGSTSNGPITATPYLNSATSSWRSELALNITFNDDDDGDAAMYSNFAFNGHARLPYRQELLNAGCSTSNNSCPTWLLEYIRGTTRISGIDGYWTASADASNSYPASAWVVSYYGRLGTVPTGYSNYYGVRPVIQVNVSYVG